jgi:hypothetical protein
MAFSSQTKATNRAVMGYQRHTIGLVAASQFKLGHCEKQIRPWVETGQNPRRLRPESVV